MTSTAGRRRLPWIVPGVVAVAVAGSAALATANSSGATPNLPPRTAAQLLVALQKSTTTALSGRVHENLDLGLPSLPGDQSSASLSWQSLLTGAHSARVWVDGVGKQRVALLADLSEADVVHNGRDVWTYTSDTNSVSHVVLPAARAHDVPAAAEITPTAAAQRVLEAIDPSTAVSVDSAQTVAGRSAYTLVLRPRDHRSTVSEIAIAIDAQRSVPLQLQVFAGGSSPAFQTGFTDISFSTPAASVFDFTAPAGAKVSKDPFGVSGHDGRQRAFGTVPGPARSQALAPKIIGSGWTTVLELHGSEADALLNGTLGRLTTAATSAGSGARLLHSALVNAVVLADGRTFIGAVQPAALEAIAAKTSG